MSDPREARPELVLVHGWGLGNAVWQSLVGPLAEGGGLRLVDLPGYPGSATSTPIDFDTAVQMLLDTIPTRASLCGWSLGGMLALRAAVLAPERVAALLLVATTPSFTQRADWSAAQPRAIVDAFAETVEAHPARTLQRFVSLVCEDDAQARPVGRQLLAALRAAPLPASACLHRGLDWLRDVDLRSLLTRVTAPTLLIHGEKDRLTPLAAARHVLAKIPRARLEVFSDAAHAPFLADPARFVRLVGAFRDER